MNFLSVFLLGVLALLPAASAQPALFQEKAVDGALLRQVREGGYVLYLRHGSTDTSRPDRAPQVDLNDCATQRPLTAEGLALARRVGVFIRAARLPLGDIFASPLCRAKESAQAAFGRYVVDNNLMYTGNMTDAEKAPVVAGTRKQLSTPVAAGTNRVLVAHAPNLMDLMGYFPKPEGTLVIFRPLGDGRFEYLGSIRPEHWPDLLGSFDRR
ncbi:histidine phosphatase family protein [bacterium]|nr:histidine phosphatase family protein [bacterium]